MNPEREPLEPNAAARREERIRHEAPAELVLLRHGEPDWTPGGGLSVDAPALTPRGHAQARAAAEALARGRIDAIYVSPLRRARETATPLAEATGIEPEVVDGLAEIGIELGGLSQVEVDGYFVRAMQRPLRDHWEGWPGGESFRDFHARVSGTVTALLRDHGMPLGKEDEFKIWQVPEHRQRIVLVAHGGTNSVALTHLLDVAPVPWEWNRFESELAAYSAVHARPVGVNGFVWSLQSFNEVGHLRSAGLR